MDQTLCPACARAPLGRPTLFAGIWYVGCPACHSEIPVCTDAAVGAEPPTPAMVAATAGASGAALYRRRTPF